MAISTIDNNGVNLGQLGNRNLIINGAMQVAQRGTTGTSTAGGYLSVDRFSYVRSAYTPSMTRSQETDGPSGFSNSYKTLTSTAASVPSNGYASIFQYIEAQDLQHLEYGSSTAKTVTLSFWAKSNVTGTFAFALTTFDTSTLFNSATYAISSANTWEYKTITFDGQTTNAIDNDAGAGIRVEWCLSSGSDRTSGSNGVWSSPAANRFAGHSVDITGTINNFLSITGVQLELGDTATPFEHRSFGDELAKCQRYFRVIGPYGNPRAAGGNDFFLVNVMHNNEPRLCAPYFDTAFRATPSVTLINHSNGGTGALTEFSSGTVRSQTSFSQIGLRGGGYPQFNGNFGNPAIWRAEYNAEL